MIHHVSISAHDPKHVAEVLAELMNGRCYPFPGGVADSFMAVSFDEHIALVPGRDDRQVGTLKDARADYAPFHMLLSVPVDRATVERIGEREGWRTRYFGRGAPGEKPVFHVIEFWVENRLMIEVATPDMVEEYTRVIQREALEAAFGRHVAA
jgi:hypothetical protein